MERTSKPVTVRVGVDTGGTFTDFVIWKDGRLCNRKVLSTPRTLPRPSSRASGTS
ncbi:MAG: hypothetical protein MZV70_66720 [Desulfobacterales bacterium]|nr:hypothetical protein [Desulfobacterales bacterium]